MMPDERLQAWKLGHELTLETYESRSTSLEELQGLVSQAGRAALSSSVNIVEGSTKRGAREFRRFLDMSLASLSELAQVFRPARELGYATPELWASLEPLRVDRPSSTTHGRRARRPTPTAGSASWPS